jgi:hypothetical protein
VFAVYTLSRQFDKDRWRPVYAPLEDHNVIAHMAGQMEIGSYPLIPDAKWPRVRWILADFDGKRPGVDWRSDVQRAVEFLSDFDGCPVFVNLSRSGDGAHVRMLFKDSVPAWLARRWLTAWLEEANVMIDVDDWDAVPPSFDRLIPPQDTLSGGLNPFGYRLPGNLAGSPLNGRHARRNGGTLPLDPTQVALGNFEPDGKHWEHVLHALEQRTWGEAKLLNALKECPGARSTEAPSTYYGATGGITPSLPVLPGNDRGLEYMVKFCAFFRHMMEPGAQIYPLWVAMATELHRFGDEGHQMFHEISSQDPRYNPRDVDHKWEQTKVMNPVRCDTLIPMGFRCPHLGTPRCNGSKAPTYFTDHTDAEIL